MRCASAADWDFAKAALTLPEMNSWNPDDLRLVLEKDNGNFGWAVNWYWVVHPRKWWGLWRASRQES